MQIDTYIILFIIELSSKVWNIEIISTKNNLKNRIFYGIIQKETDPGIKVVDCLLYKSIRQQIQQYDRIGNPLFF